MSKLLIAVLALFGASVVSPAPVMASGNSDAAWWFLGGTLFGHFVTGAQRVQPRALPQGRVGQIHCPAGTVHYEQATNRCFIPVAAPQVAVAAVPQVVAPVPQLSAEQIAAQAYSSLGPAPDGRKVANHSVQKEPGKTCTDGTAAKLVKQTSTPGFTNYRYHCP